MSLDNLKTLCDILRTAMPSSPAVIVASQPSRIYTREMILQFIQMLSSKFASLGISTGDAVCLVTTNTIEYIVRSE
jgi:non-ribosomal peptide synthetase component E (peptide arylation enzyme)